MLVLPSKWTLRIELAISRHHAFLRYPPTKEASTRKLELSVTAAEFLLNDDDLTVQFDRQMGLI